MIGELIGLLVPITFILAIAGVILLRPLSHRLADLLEVITAERRNPSGVEGTLSRIQQSLDAIDDRLRLVEERQDFTDQLLRGRADTGKPTLGSSSPSAAAPASAGTRSNVAESA